MEVQVNVVTPQELGVCGKSNEIDGEKIVLGSTAEKKKFLLFIRSEKIVCLSWQLKKMKTIAPPPPMYQMVRPLGIPHTGHTTGHCSKNLKWQMYVPNL